jgi:hypothetical protein
MTEPEQDGLVSEYETFAMLPEWVLDAEISDRAVRLFALLLRYANKGGKAWPTRKTLQERLRVGSLDSVDRAIADLVKIGALEVVRRGGKPGEAFTSSVYVLKRAPSRTGAATPSRTDAATLAAPVRHEREPLERETPPATQGAPKRKPTRTRVTDDFAPTEATLTWAAERWPAVNVADEVEGFVLYHQGRGSLMADWQRTFQTWIRNAGRRGGSTRQIETRHTVDATGDHHDDNRSAFQ